MTQTRDMTVKNGQIQEISEWQNPQAVVGGLRMMGERRHQRRLSSFWLTKIDGRSIHYEILEIQRWERRSLFNFPSLKSRNIR